MAMRALLVTAVVVTASLPLAGVAHADEQSYLDGLAAHGMTYGGASIIGIGFGAPSQAVKAGQMVCDNIRFSGDPRAGFNMLMNASVPDYLIDVARSELCPA